MDKKLMVSIVVVFLVGVVVAGSYGILHTLNRRNGTVRQGPIDSSAVKKKERTDGTTQSSASSGVPVLGVTEGTTLSLDKNKVPSGDTQPTDNGLPSPDKFESYDTLKNNATASYIDILSGGGREARAQTKVALLYKGWLTDGTLFDTSKKNADGTLEPLIFTIGSGEVVPGFDQGVLGMKVGGKRRIIIPPALGYGAAGQGPIPPDAVLVFDIELLDALDPQ